MIAAATTRCEDGGPSVLVAEEDDVARAFLADNLAADRYVVWTADSKEKALAILSVRQPHVIVVDVNGKTLGLIDAVRAGKGLAGRVDPDTPLIVLTARADELHRIRVLDRGGDDVLAKPYSYPELRARRAALLRRARARQAPRVLRVGELTIDLAARTVDVRGTRVELPAKEFELLRALAREPTRVFTREELVRDVWGHGYGGRTRTLDSHACRLRHRLADAGADGLLRNVWGVGFRLTDPIASPHGQRDRSPLDCRALAGARGRGTAPPPGRGLDLLEALAMAHDGIVYLLHFDRSYRHALHYIGFTQNLDQRLADHRAGRGSPLIAAAIADGIDFQLAAIWEGDRHDERRLHRQKNTRARLCPICVAGDRAAGPRPTVDLVDELLLSVLGGIPQPATLSALQAQLRRRGKRIGSIHGRLEVPALRGRVSKTWLLGEIAWAIVTPANPMGATQPSAGRERPA